MPMLRLQSGVWWLGALLALTPTSASALPAVQHTIQFFGCDVDAEDLLVRARPVTRVDATPTELSPSALPFDRIDFNPSSGSRMIHPVNTGSPGSFAFAFEELDPTTIYRIGIKLQGRAAQQCPRLAWYSNREALFVAGNEPLQIRGFALQSDLEILGAAQGRGQESWVPSDNIDFADPIAAVRSFRWRTSVPGADGGVIWLAPDILLEPAVVTLHLWGTGVPLATRPLLIRNIDSVFGLGNTLLPRRLPAPSQPSLQVPMVLQPNLEGLKDPEPGHTEYGKAVWFKDHWYAERFVNSCYHLVVTALAPGDVIPLVNAMFTPDKDPIQACSK